VPTTDLQSPTSGRTGRPEEDVDPKSFGGQLRNARKKLYSAESFAEAMEVRRPTVVRWETNQAVPPASAFDRINHLLGTKFTRPSRARRPKGSPKAAGKTASQTKLAKQLIAALVSEGLIDIATPEKQRRLERFVSKHMPTINKEKERRSKQRSK
jgi:transcriptional regulator with XRE-family HTH domain